MDALHCQKFNKQSSRWLTGGGGND
jgi:hypothetical protein